MHGLLLWKDVSLGDLVGHKVQCSPSIKKPKPRPIKKAAQDQAPVLRVGQITPSRSVDFSSSQRRNL